MKIRNGFVSNSSSASFIIIWQKFNVDMSLKQYICHLFEVAYDAENDKVASDSYHEDEKLANYVIKNTREVSSGFYETRTSTSMKNSMADFDPEFHIFASTLLIQRDARIVKAEVDDD